LIDGKPKALNIPAQLVEKVREKIEMRRRFDAAAATICGVNLKRFLKEKLQEKEIGKVEPAPVRGLSRQKVFDAVFWGAAMQIPSLLPIEAECRHGCWPSTSDRSATTPWATRSKDNLPNPCSRSVAKLPAA
jgi:hypothetical protein